MAFGHGKWPSATFGLKPNAVEGSFRPPTVSRVGQWRWGIWGFGLKLQGERPKSSVARLLWGIFKKAFP